MHGIEQLIPSWYNDFPDGTVMIMQNYGLTDDWQNEFKSVAGAANGSIAHVKLGHCLTVQAEQGNYVQRYYALGVNNWIEKLFPCKKHKALSLVQFLTLYGINISDEYKDNQTIRCLYFTFDESVRTFAQRKQISGCGLIHKCPVCKKLGCYEHLALNDANFDFSGLEYVVECHCGYSFNLNEKIALRGSFQGVIPCFLCYTNSSPTLSSNGIEYIRDYFG